MGVGDGVGLGVGVGDGVGVGVNVEVGVGRTDPTGLALLGVVVGEGVTEQPATSDTISAIARQSRIVSKRGMAI